ncbi:MAG: ribosome silencing factor [Planctomycetota bacterium]|nr:ribosome silencing factor [Planctomycetota bacterium]MDA1180071.1 ribosome silencing factor [Planctomycetota bacterium]
MISTSTTLQDLEQRQVRSLALAQAAARTAAADRGQDVIILDLRSLTQFFDFFVIATGTSRRQVHAMSEDIVRTLAQELNDRRIGREGYEESRWILLDYGSVVVHLFDQETREYYSLETLWAEAPRIEWKLSEMTGSATNGTLFATTPTVFDGKEIA